MVPKALNCVTFAGTWLIHVTVKLLAAIFDNVIFAVASRYEKLKLKLFTGYPVKLAFIIWSLNVVFAVLLL